MELLLVAIGELNAALRQSARQLNIVAESPDLEEAPQLNIGENVIAIMTDIRNALLEFRHVSTDNQPS
jgi:hypothetical protein